MSTPGGDFESWIKSNVSKKQNTFDTILNLLEEELELSEVQDFLYLEDKDVIDAINESHTKLKTPVLRKFQSAINKVRESNSKQPLGFVDKLLGSTSGGSPEGPSLDDWIKNNKITKKADSIKLFLNDYINIKSVKDISNKNEDDFRNGIIKCGKKIKLKPVVLRKLNEAVNKLRKDVNKKSIDFISEKEDNDDEEEEEEEKTQQTKVTKTSWYSKILQESGLVNKKNKKQQSYVEAFADLGFENIGELVTTSEKEVKNELNIRMGEWNKLVKVLKKHNIKLGGDTEEKEKELTSIEKYPDRKSYKGIYSVKALKKVPCQDDVTNGKPIKTILVVGQTGTGKTTCLNSMMNYLFDVDFNDKYRFKLINEDKLHEERIGNQQSMTDDVTAYYIEPCNPKIKYNLALVDTPGFGDTRGIEQDKKIVKKIKEFFEKKLETLTGVCFVIKSSETRLHASQKYIFSQLFSIFGKDIADNIFVLITFCDGGRPNALDALNAKDVQCPYKDYFKLNNSAFFNDERDKMTKMFWDMGMEAFEKFFVQLGTTTDKSLTLTKQVLQQREKLVLYIGELHQKISKGTAQMRALANLEEALEALADKIDQCREFEVTTTEYYVDLEAVPNGQFTTYCIDCRKTCHESCGIPNDGDKRGCASMSGDNCYVCSGKCHWSKHINYGYYVREKSRQVTKNSEELFEKYGKATGEASQTDHFIEQIEQELAILKVDVLNLIEEVTVCNDKLKEQALRHNPVSQKDYVLLMIQSEKRDKKDGYLERIKSLEQLLKSLELIESINNSSKKNKDLESIKLFDVTNKRQKRRDKSDKIRQSRELARQKGDSTFLSKMNQWANDSKNAIKHKISSFLE